MVLGLGAERRDDAGRAVVTNVWVSSDEEIAVG